MQKHSKDKGKLTSHSVEEEEVMTTEDPEFPAPVSLKEDESTLFTDVERKKREINDSTVGGF